MSVQDQTVSFSLEVNVEKGLQDVRRLQTVLYRALDLLEKTGTLGEGAQKKIAEIQRLITVLNQLRLALLAVQTASGPLGWALAGIGVVTGLASAGAMIEDAGWDLHRHSMSW